LLYIFSIYLPDEDLVVVVLWVLFVVLLSEEEELLLDVVDVLVLLLSVLVEVVRSEVEVRPLLERPEEVLLLLLSVLVFVGRVLGLVLVPVEFSGRVDSVGRVDGLLVLLLG